MFHLILKKHRLSRTKSRLDLLKVLFQSEMPLAERDIEQRMKGLYNRTTIYRNLNTLAKHGILQRIISNESLKFKYIVQETRKPQKHDHVHFQCRVCNKVFCMEELLVKDYRLPTGYSKLENHFLILGICKDCNHE